MWACYRCLDGAYDLHGGWLTDAAGGAQHLTQKNVKLRSEVDLRFAREDFLPSDLVMQPSVSESLPLGGHPQGRLSPVGFDPGGISGGPMMIVVEKNGLWQHVLAGVVVEFPKSRFGYETVVATPAHFVGADGRINPRNAPMRPIRAAR